MDTATADKQQLIASETALTAYFVWSKEDSAENM